MLGRREEITPQRHWKQFHLIKTRFTHTEAARAEADFLAHAISDVHWAGNPGQKHAITIGPWVLFLAILIMKTFINSLRGEQRLWLDHTTLNKHREHGN